MGYVLICGIELTAMYYLLLQVAIANCHFVIAICGSLMESVVLSHSRSEELVLGLVHKGEPVLWCATGRASAIDPDPGPSFQCLVVPVSSAFLVCDVGMSVPTLHGGPRERMTDRCASRCQV